MYPSNQNSFAIQGSSLNSNINTSKSSQTPNPYLQPQFLNQGFISPQAGSFNANRNVYASTIHASTSSSNLSQPGVGFGRLQSMGRTIKDDSDSMNLRSQTTSSYSTNGSNHYSFMNNSEKGKLASSVIFQKNYDEQMSRFPGFNLQNGAALQVGTSKLDAIYSKKQNNQTSAVDTPVESAQDKRKRQIEAIKQELSILNKRMESTVTKKIEGQSKPYFQLPSRKTPDIYDLPSTSTFTESLKGANSQNGSKQASDVAGVNSLFLKYAKGSEDSTDKAIFQKATKESDISANRKLFQKYAQSESPLVQKTNTVIKLQQKSPQTFQTSSLTTIEPIKNQTGGMFKKKNPYLSDQPTKTFEYTPKTFMISPKNSFNQGFKAQPIAANPQAAKYQIKISEPIDPINTKKGMKIPFPVENVVSSGPKTFKKSDFAIGKKMGKGQFGQVMLVIHKETGFLCGMKVMSKKQIREESYVNQIARQLSIQFYLNHRNVAPLYGYFQDEENVYLLIEYCTGGQLLQLLRKARRMSEADTSPIIRQICQGLDYIHKEEIIHRDIKPENILFNFNTVKICDFGWAVHCGSGMRKTVSGSPLYYSPEVVQQTEYDQKVDIWAIGMMTYECLIGKIPFKIYSEMDLNRIVQDEVKFPEYIDVSDDAKSFILGIMQKNPDDRMIMKDIFKHPFIRKYLSERKVASQIIEEFRRVLN